MDQISLIIYPGFFWGSSLHFDDFSWLQKNDSIYA